MKPSGIDGCGIRPVSAKTPNAMVRMQEKTAGGMLSSCAWAMELGGGD
jgi:hypothetical protein